MEKICCVFAVSAVILLLHSTSLVVAGEVIHRSVHCDFCISFGFLFSNFLLIFFFFFFCRCEIMETIMIGKVTFTSSSMWSLKTCNRSSRSNSFNFCYQYTNPLFPTFVYAPLRSAIFINSSPYHVVVWSNLSNYMLVSDHVSNVDYGKTYCIPVFFFNLSSKSANLGQWH